MIRALFTAATGMNAQEINVATISNNIANVNPTGFKKSRAEFQDLLYQNLRLVGTLSPNGNQIPTGSQLGLGTKLGSIARVYTQGDFIQTRNELDLAITGRGFSPHINYHSIFYGRLS
jgi:flagellar basal-body rod protein FlgG